MTAQSCCQLRTELVRRFASQAMAVSILTWM